MLNVEKLNQVLSILNITISRNNTMYFVYDNDTNTSSLLKLNKNNYEFDKQNYHVQIQESKIIISNDNNELLVIDDNGINYLEKENNDHFYKTNFLVSDNKITFYKKDDNTGRSIQLIVSDDSFNYLKLSETVIQNGELKTDSTISKNDGKILRVNRTRKYNKEGHRITGSIQSEEFDGEISEYIKNEIKDNPLIEEMFEKIDSFIPDLSEYLKENNTHLKSISKQKQKTIE